MVEIECLVCRKKIRFPQYIDPNNYDGQLYCRACQLLLDVKLVASKVRKYKVAEKQTKPRPPVIKLITAVPRPDYPKNAQQEPKKLK